MRRRGTATTARSPPSSTTAMTTSEIHVGMCTHSAMIIFTPTKARMTARPCWRKRKRPWRSASRKYIERSPRMAKAFDENTMNCSWLTASTAGTLSTAKIRSVSSTSTSTANSGVARRLPSIFVNRCGPSSSSVLGTTRLTSLRNRLLLGSTWSLVVRQQQPHRGEQQERAEHVEDPVEALDQGDAGEDERRPQHERAEDAPEQHPVLVLRRHRRSSVRMIAQTKTLSTLRLCSTR